MSAALDRPCWSALTGPQAALARHHGRALRIDPGYGPFAAAEPGGTAIGAEPPPPPPLFQFFSCFFLPLTLSLGCIVAQV